MFLKDRGEVAQIIDHGMKKQAMNGKEIDCLKVLVEWKKGKINLNRMGQIDFSSVEDMCDQKYSWEPVKNMVKDVPEIVHAYFEKQGLDVAKVLDDDSAKSLAGFKRRSRSKNSKAKAVKDSNPLKVGMTRAEVLKEKRMKRFAEAEKLKVKDNLTQDILGGTGQELIKPVTEKVLKTSFTSSLSEFQRETTQVSSSEPAWDFDQKAAPKEGVDPN